MIIAIDGPAGAGKSTVARQVAHALGLTFLDTGAMYRAVTLEVLRRGLDPDSEEACAQVARDIQLTFDEAGRVRIDGRAGEPAIRSPDVTAAVSIVSAHGPVRSAIVAEQRAVAAASRSGSGGPGGSGGVVAEGRDTTTVVFPDADHKFFLIATPAERARRRALELGRVGDTARVHSEIERRDALDSNRSHSPLRRAPDATVIDTEGCSAEDVVARVVEHVRARASSSTGGP